MTNFEKMIFIVKLQFMAKFDIHIVCEMSVVDTDVLQHVCLHVPVIN